MVKRESVCGSDLVGAAEVAALAGVPRSTIRTWTGRGKLPAPFAVLAMGPVWLKRDIQDWLKRP